MDLQLNIDAEQINKYVSQKILESSIGQSIEKVIKEKLGDWCYGYDSPIKKEIQKVVAEEARRQIRLPENVKVISDAVAEVLTSQGMSMIVKKGFEICDWGRD